MAKQCIQIIASEETYQNLQTFKDIKQLNEAIRIHKKQFQEELSTTALSVLDILHRYAAKFKGVSFLTKNNIAEKLGKSRRTIIRVCRQLEQLGIIKQYEMKRRTDMRQTSNAIVIQPIQEHVTQEQAEMSHQKELSFKTKQEKNNITAAKELLKKYADLKINDILQKGVTVKYISSYIGKLFKSLETQSLYAANNQANAKRKQQKEQANQWYLESMGLTREKCLYNWLEK